VDDSSFGLSEHLRVLYHAGIRSILESDPEQNKVNLLSVSPWTDFVSKLPVTAKSIWSYPDLVYDLTGRASQNRSVLWRTMIRTMDLPKGYIGFFPYTLPSDNVLVSYFDHFFEAVKSYVPTTIVIFGDALFAEKLLSLISSSEAIAFPSHVVAAPSPEELCSFSSDELKRYSSKLLPTLLTGTEFSLA
jgi:hypothetical protein